MFSVLFPFVCSDLFRSVPYAFLCSFNGMFRISPIGFLGVFLAAPATFNRGTLRVVKFYLWFSLFTAATLLHSGFLLGKVHHPKRLHHKGTIVVLGSLEGSGVLWD